jgi:membrane-associated phospholipid phosphatase
MSDLNRAREDRGKKLGRFMAFNIGLALLAGSFFLDGTMAEFVSLVRRPGLTAAMLTVTQLGHLISLLLVVACVYVFGFVSSHDGHRRTALLAAVALFAAGFSVLLFKLLAARNGNGEFYWVWGWNRQTMMFPSGHAAMICAVSVVLGRIYRPLRWPLVVIVLAVAVSRVYLYHFFSDVVGGLFLGWAISSMALGYASKWKFIGAEPKS